MENEMKQEFKETCGWIKKRLGGKIADVHITNGLAASTPCVLVSGRFGWSANMERFMKAQGCDPRDLEMRKGMRVLEINPQHPIIKALDAACKCNPDDDEAKTAIDLLYDAAVITSGYTPENPASIGGRIFEMMQMVLLERWPAAPADSGSLEQQVDTETPEAPPQAGSQN